MDDRYDNVLFSILKEAKTIPNFFDIIFGFLFRRTDFYHIASNPNLGVGLPEGVAKKLLLQGYNKYINQLESDNIPPAPLEKKEFVKSETEKPKSISDCYNGAQYENYSWSQTITDVDIQVKIPENINPKNLHVDITSTKICVKLKNTDEVFLNDEFCRKCKTQETIWSIDGNTLQIHLEKSSESWWDCLLQSEPKLDFNKMDCSRPFHELSDEAQAKIEELQWNQERKRQGLPTSDQLELENTLKQAWNAEGSPFTGPYDPTKVSLS